MSCRCILQRVCLLVGCPLTGYELIVARGSRGFLGSVRVPGRPSLRAPVRPWIAPEIEGGESRLAEAGEHDETFVRDLAEPPARPAYARQPLEGVRILELTVAWAGPFVGRLLGALGADVVKIEGVERPDGWRGPVAFGDAAPQLGRERDALSIDIAPNYNSVNRNTLLRHAGDSHDHARRRSRRLPLVVADSGHRQQPPVSNEERARGRDDRAGLENRFQRSL